MGNGQGVVYNAEEHYKWQCDRLASYFLLGDTDIRLAIGSFSLNNAHELPFKLINKGEIIAGSYVASLVDKVNYANSMPIVASDIDVYFKSKDDAIVFAKLNNFGLNPVIIDNANMCWKIATPDINVNMIWGVEFTDLYSLISKFDIRVCSMALIDNKIFYIDGAQQDLMVRQIVFNPIPRATSINRLVKYIQKGFHIDAYQRLFFAQLIKSDIYSDKLELTTGY